MGSEIELKGVLEKEVQAGTGLARNALFGLHLVERLAPKQSRPKSIGLCGQFSRRKPALLSIEAWMLYVQPSL
ncbi:unnamed protein product [Haemonchus placei]|uniref:Mobile element protein n=1 Tax=Haemonchus placei TaxID=6290 RepID=A0A0N4X5M1_HAEPC|nr:unnamed protein product [Haemonchus placei]